MRCDLVILPIFIITDFHSIVTFNWVSVNPPYACHNDVIKWKHSPLYWSFVLGIHRSSQRPVTRSFDIYLDLRWINAWVNYGKAGDLRRHSAHYDVIVIALEHSLITRWLTWSLIPRFFASPGHLQPSRVSSHFLRWGMIQSTCAISVWERNDKNLYLYVSCNIFTQTRIKLALA